MLAPDYENVIFPSACGGWRDTRMTVKVFHAGTTLKRSHRSISMKTFLTLAFLAAALAAPVARADGAHHLEDAPQTGEA